MRKRRFQGAALGLGVALLGCGVADPLELELSARSAELAGTERHYFVRSQQCTETSHQPSGSTLSHGFAWWLDVAVSGPNGPWEISGYELKPCQNVQPVPYRFCLEDASTRAYGEWGGSRLELHWESRQAVWSAGVGEFLITTSCTLRGGLGGAGVDATGAVVSEPMRRCWTDGKGPPENPVERVPGGHLQRYPGGAGTHAVRGENACMQRDGSPEAFAVTGPFYEKWVELGGVETVGLPLSQLALAEVATPGAPTQVPFQQFERGVLYRAPNQTSLTFAAALPTFFGPRPGEKSVTEINPRIEACFVDNGGEAVLGAPLGLVAMHRVHWSGSWKNVAYYQAYAAGGACVDNDREAYLLTGPVRSIYFEFGYVLGKLAGPLTVEDPVWLEARDPYDCCGKKVKRTLRNAFRLKVDKGWVTCSESGRDCFLTRRVTNPYGHTYDETVQWLERGTFLNNL